MNDLLTIRASSGPAATICPGSIRGGNLKIRRHNDLAPLGQGTHEVLAGHLKGEETSVVDVAAKHGLDNPDEMAMLVRFGAKAWDEFGDVWKPADTEVFLAGYLVQPMTVALVNDEGKSAGTYTGYSDQSSPGVRITGHMDIIAIRPEIRWAGVGDWKTGRIDANYRAQLAGYAFLVFENYPEIDIVDTAAIWLRDQTKEEYRFTRAQAYAWRDEFVARVVNWDGRFYMGEHCGHCERSHDCPALVASARRDIAILGEHNLAEDVIAGGLKTMDDVSIATLLRKANGIGKFLDTFGDVVRAEIRNRGGAIDAGNGQEYKFLVTEPREVDPLLAWPVIQSRMSDEEIAGVCKVSISKAAEVVKGHAVKGKGAAAIRELDAALEEAGAISRRHQESLKLVRK